MVNYDMLENITDFEGSTTQFFILEYNIVIFFGYVNKVQCPEAKEDDFYIMVCTKYIYESDGKPEEYRISLYEPKYVYNSDKLPDDIRDVVINNIIKNYYSGIESINEYMEENIIDINRPIPDYTKLP